MISLRNLALLGLVAIACRPTFFLGPNPPQGDVGLDFVQLRGDSGLEYVTGLAFVEDQMLAVDLYGGWAVYALDGSTIEEQMRGTFDDVYVEYDAGLLGLALDPDFDTNRMFYVAGTSAIDTMFVRRYTLVDGDPAATEASAVTIVDLEVTGGARFHNISSLGFDEQGVMWMLVGEKGGPAAAQNPNNWRGSLVRIQPSTEPGEGGYTVPEDQVTFSDTSDPAVLAIGIRSPWKGVYYDRRWYFGDVGDQDFEELNVIEEREGQNLGWPVIEGSCEVDVFGNDPVCEAFVDPIRSFARDNSESAVIDDRKAVPTNKRSIYVGFIREPSEPDPYGGALDGVIIHGDAFVGWVRGRRVDDLEDDWHMGHLEFPGGWAQGPDGYLYVAALSERPPNEDIEDTSNKPSPFYRVLTTDPED